MKNKSEENMLLLIPSLSLIFTLFLSSSFKDSSPIETREAVGLNDQETNKRRLVADNVHVLSSFFQCVRVSSLIYRSL